MNTPANPEAERMLRLCGMAFMSENPQEAEHIINHTGMIFTWGAKQDEDRALGIITLAPKDKRSPALIVFAPPADSKGDESAIDAIIEGLIEMREQRRAANEAKQKATGN